MWMFWWNFPVFMAVFTVDCGKHFFPIYHYLEQGKLSRIKTQKKNCEILTNFFVYSEIPERLKKHNKSNHKKQVLCFQQQQKNRWCHDHNINKLNLKLVTVCSSLQVVCLTWRAAQTVNMYFKIKDRLKILKDKV